MAGAAAGAAAMAAAKEPAGAKAAEVALAVVAAEPGALAALVAATAEMGTADDAPRRTNQTTRSYWSSDRDTPGHRKSSRTFRHPLAAMLQSRICHQNYFCTDSPGSGCMREGWIPAMPLKAARRSRHRMRWRPAGTQSGRSRRRSWRQRCTNHSSRANRRRRAQVKGSSRLC